jgi:hypothetical protein
MRRERNIKIGFSKDPKRRAGEISGAELLAKEPGGAGREGELHLRFQHLRVGGEWFEPGPDLIAYINALRREAGLRPIGAEPPVPAKPA